MKPTIYLCACVGAFALVVLVTAAPAAQDQVTPSGRVLVLDNERVLEGEVLRQGDQFVIRGKAGGELKVPASKALTVCASLEDAFQFLSSRANLQDGAERLRLARWCQLCGLREQAIAEAKASLLLRPGHPESKQLLTVLELANAPAPVPRPVSAAPAPVDAAPLDVTGESLSLFSTNVQPILMNACASCHAAGKGGAFVLTRPTDGSGRRALQLNLAATIKQINFDQPAGSPLLNKAASAHGGAARGGLLSRQAVPFQTLQNWTQLLTSQNPHLKPLGTSVVAGALASVPSGFAQPKVDGKDKPSPSPLPPSNPVLPAQYSDVLMDSPIARSVEILASAAEFPGAAAITPTVRPVGIVPSVQPAGGAPTPRTVGIRPSPMPKAVLAPAGTPRSLPGMEFVPEQLSGPYDPKPFNDMVQKQSAQGSGR